MFNVRFYTLTGPLRVERSAPFATFAEARDAAFAHAIAGNFTKPKVVEPRGYEDDGFRVTATTPGGRAGRNVATIDPFDAETVRP